MNAPAAISPEALERAPHILEGVLEPVPPVTEVGGGAPAASSGLTRLFGAFMFLALVAGLYGIGRTVYLALSDSFIAPAILSPDSEIVLANRLKMSEIAVERARAAAELDGIAADLAAADKAIVRLRDLERTADRALGWSVRANGRKQTVTTAELQAIAEKTRLLTGMLAEQKARVEKAKADLDAGVLSREDYAREEQTMQQLELALLENQRASLQSASALRETAFTQKALARPETEAAPEVLTRQEQRIRVELEILRLESEMRAKRAQKQALEHRIATIDQLKDQLMRRPIFQAVTRSLDVAFVPYTQLDSVEPGAPVYECVWGLFWCQPVGQVAELIPGEVILPDPWGNPARGQYAVLDLRDRQAARSKTLRVRHGADRRTAASVP